MTEADHAALLDRNAAQWLKQQGNLPDLPGGYRWGLDGKLLLPRGNKNCLGFSQ